MTPNNKDLSNIQSHSHQLKIPCFYDKHKWNIGETYRLRVGNIYDPSKFWAVLKERELEVFHGFINNFYAKQGSSFKVPPDSLSRNMYCTVFVDGGYYRATIISIPLCVTRDKKAYVFIFDFGYTTMVSLDDIYYLAEKFYEVPRFAVRACLSNLRPYDEHTWSWDVVKRFTDLVSNKVLLCVLENTDPKRQVIEIKLGCVEEFSNVTDIGNILINEKLAMTLTSRDLSANMKNNSRYAPKTKYPYLFPSFEAIESGMVPPSVQVSETLIHCVARDVLFKPYFKYKGVWIK